MYPKSKAATYAIQTKSLKDFGIAVARRRNAILGTRDILRKWLMFLQSPLEGSFCEQVASKLEIPDIAKVKSNSGQ